MAASVRIARTSWSWRTRCSLTAPRQQSPPSLSGPLRGGSRPARRIAIGPSTSRLGDPTDDGAGRRLPRSTDAPHQTRTDAATNPFTDAEEGADDDIEQRRIAAALANDDHQALEDAYRRWGGMIHALCTRWADADAADDLTQQVFVAAWQGRANHDPSRGDLGAWLVGIARNLTNRSFRGVREIPTDPTDVTRVDRPEDDGADQVADELLLATVLTNLPEPQRLTLELSYWEGLTQAEVADRLDMPLGTVKSHQRRGLRRLRHALEVNHGRR